MAFVSVKVNPPSGTVVLNHPARRNALGTSMLEEVSQALSDLHQEKKVRCVIMAGAGNDFSAGADLVELHESTQQPATDALQQWYEYWNRLRELLEQMLRFPKPLIAAVDGAALGSGFSLVLACDLVVASPASKFGVPAIQRGLIGGSVAPLLAWRLGGSTASRLLLTGETISAEEAKHLGLVHAVVPPEHVWVKAQAYAEMCAQGPREALQLTKRLLNETIAESVLSQLSVGTAMNATACTTEAAAEGLKAFVEKRAPKWP